MITEKLKPGQSGEIEEEITMDLTTNRMGRPGAEVLSTPSLLSLMERSAISASDGYLAHEYTTVGYAVDGMRHLAPTALGERIRVKAVLTDVEGNRLTYSIEAFEGDKKIGMAMHKRAIISKETGT